MLPLCRVWLCHCSTVSLYVVHPGGWGDLYVCHCAVCLLARCQAVLTAAILEFGGAFLVGSHVSHTHAERHRQRQGLCGPPHGALHGDARVAGSLGDLAPGMTPLSEEEMRVYSILSSSCVVHMRTVWPEIAKFTV